MLVRRWTVNRVPIARTMIRQPLPGEHLKGSSRPPGRGTVADLKANVAAIYVPSGTAYRDEVLHLWTFDEAGKVSRFRHYVDTAKHIAASQAG